MTVRQPLVTRLRRGMQDRLQALAHKVGPDASCPEKPSVLDHIVTSGDGVVKLSDMRRGEVGEHDWISGIRHYGLSRYARWVVQIEREERLCKLLTGHRPLTQVGDGMYQCGRCKAWWVVDAPRPTHVA